MQEIVVTPGEGAKKLANFLKKKYPIGYVRKLFRKNGIRLNGQRAKTDDAVHTGDRIQLYIPFEATAAKIIPSSSLNAVTIMYEDESLLVLDKPAGVAVHEGSSVRRSESVAGFIEKKYRGEKFLPKLAHRLDKDTSGLLVLAKSEKALAELEERFESGKVDKEYLCLVVGRVPNNEGKIDLPLPGRDGDLVRAVTHYRVVKRFAETTLLRVDLETGRLHQIRLHFAKLGYPVVMDQQHGDFNFNKKFRQRYGLKRQFLHAEKLSIVCAGKRHRWTAPLAEDLQKTLKLLEND
ncbi:MAG: RluA family pseudouridine synthase [Deltaproteobacteria bacterium]|nr:RluA family pseudouridine synthase [Deltaproteobacteria bacterium]